MRVVSVTMVALAIGLALGAERAEADPRPDETWVTDGTVYAFAFAGDRIFIGGNFTEVGPNTGGGTSVDMTTGLRDEAFERVDGDVFAAVPDGLGGWYIAGDFLYVDGTWRPRLAHLRSNGLSSGWSPYTAGTEVTDLALVGTTLYVAGDFTSVEGLERNGVAALDVSTENDVLLPWDPNVVGPVDAITTSADGSIVYLGGDFTEVGGAAHGGLVAVDGATGTVTGTVPDVDGSVRALALSPDETTLYVGGDFSSAGATPRSHLAAVDTATGALLSWDPGPSAPVSAIEPATTGNPVYVGGSFDTVGGVTRNAVAALDTTTGAPTPWDPDVTGTVASLALSGDGTSVLMAGDFTSVGAVARKRLAGVDVATGAASPWDPGANGPALVVSPQGSAAYVGGEFGSVNGVPRSYLAALDATTGTLIMDWDPAANDEVRALATSPTGDLVYVGGKFTTIDGATNRYLTAIDPLTGLDVASWEGRASNSVRALAVGNGRVYAGGDFALVNGVARTRLGAVDVVTGALDPVWAPIADDMVRALAVSADGSRVYLGGEFDAVDGVPRQEIAAVDAISGGVDPDWAPDTNRRVYQIATTPAGVYAAQGGGGGRLYAFDPVTGAIQWYVHNDGDTQAVTAYGDHVYAGGHFDLADGLVRRRLFAVEAATGTVDSTWLTTTDSLLGVYGMAATGGKIYLGGTFGKVDNWASDHFARVDALPFADPPPTVSIVAPPDGAEVTGTVLVEIDAADADDPVGSLGVELAIGSGAPVPAVYDPSTGRYQVVWDTTAAPDDTFALVATATDSAGGMGASGPVSIHANNVADPPVVSIVTPQDAVPIDGVIDVEVAAHDDEDDDAGLPVEVSIDGGAYQPATYDPASGLFLFAWDTTTETEGPHNVEARTTDSTGATGSASVSPIVDNVEDPPTVGIDNPADGATVRGVVTIGVAADDLRDPEGTLSVEVAVAGGPYQPAAYDPVTGWYTFSWDTAGSTDGEYVVAARATDSAGLTTDASSISLYVDEYWDTVLGRSPIAYWRLAEASGTVAADEISAHDGFYEGAPSLGAAGLIRGSSDAAVAFDGVDDAVGVPDDAAINTGGPYETRTVELWFRADDVTARQVLYEEGGGARGLSISIDDGDLYLGGWNNSSNDATTPWGPTFISKEIGADQVHHVVLVLDQPGARFEGYLDGTSFGTIPGVGRLFAHGGDIGIGAMRDDTRFHDGSAVGDGYAFTGVLDEVVLYSQAFTAADVAAHHLAGTTVNGDAPPTVAIAAPLDGQLVAGSVTVEVTAVDDVDPDGSLTVDVAVDGGTYLPATWNAASAAYEREVDTVSLSDGPHTLDARATDSAGSTVSAATISMEVDNVDEPPAVAIVTPADGSDVAGTVEIGVVASDVEDAFGSLTVEVSTDGGAAWQPAVFDPPSGRYVVAWDTTAAPDGTVQVDARASDTAANMTSAAPVTVAVTSELAYPQRVLADGPIAYWRLAETSGTVAFDETGTHDATYSGLPGLGAPGLLGDAADPAVVFDGVDDHVAIGDASAINTSGPYEAKSVELWFDAADVTPRQVLYEQGGTSRGLNVYIDQGLLYVAGWNTNADDATTPWSVVWASTPISPDVTYHAVLVFDYASDRLDGYLDGALFGSASGVGRLFSHSNDAGIGAMVENARFHDGSAGGAGYEFGGTLDEVALYNVALPAAVIADHARIGRVGNHDDPPSGSILTPADGALVAGTVPITIDAADPEDPTGSLTVEASADAGVTWLPAAFDPVNDWYVVEWDSTGTPDGPVTIEARITDSGGTAVPAGSVDVEVDNVDEPPTAVIVAPGEGAVVIGTTTVEVDATDVEDAVGTLLVEVSTDGGVTWTPATYDGASGRYTAAWDSTAGPDGPVAVEARVTDSGGSTVAAPPVTVEVDNVDEPPTVTVTAPGDGAVLTGTVPVVAVADDEQDPPGSLTVEVSVDDRTTWLPAVYDSATDTYVTMWDTAGAPDGTVTVLARAIDSGGSIAESAPVVVETENFDDPPDASIVAPADGAEVFGSTLVLLSANDGEDPVGSLTVEVSTDGGTTWSPAAFDGPSGWYRFSWDTTTAPDGPATIDARVIDSAAQEASAPSVAVTVDNVDRVPAVTVEEPTEGQLVAGVVDVIVDATDREDPAGTLTVEFSADGGTSWQLAAYDSATGRYVANWDTVPFPEGSTPIDARAIDSAGGVGIAPTVVVDVHNIDVPPTVTIEQPADGATVSGAVTVRVDATDIEDPIGTLTVEISTDAGSSWSPASWDAASTRYLATWDTTSHPDGNVQVVARATDSNAATELSPSVTVLVDNVPDGALYPDAVLAEAPVAYLRLGEATGTTAADASGNGVTASYTGGPLLGEPGLTAAATDTAVRFDAVDDAARIGDSSAVNQGGPYQAKTVQLWFLADEVSSRQVLFEQGGAARGLSVYLDGGRLYVGGWNTNADDATTPWGPSFISTPVTAGEIHNAVLVLDADAGTIVGYLDGGSFGTATGIGRLFNHSQDGAVGAKYQSTRFHSGSSGGNGDEFGGVIDEVALFNRALPESTVQALYQLGATLDPNVPPSVAVTAPTEGSTLAGTVAVEVQADDAEDPAGTLTVEVSVDDGVSWTQAAYDAGSARYTTSWDTTTVPDGPASVRARASDSGGAVTEATAVAVTVDNVDEPPVVTIVAPADGSTVVGSTVVEVGVADEDAPGVPSVEVAVAGGPYEPAAYDAGTDTYTWTWDASGLADGSYQIDARATDSLGQSSDAPPVTVTVTNSLAYPTAVLAEDPIAYWRLGDAGVAAIDASGNGHDGTLENGASPGAPGLLAGDTAVSFDGVDDLIGIPDSSAINTGGPYEQRSIEVWFRADEVTSRQVLYEQGGSARGLNLYMVDGNLYYLGWNRNSDDATTPWTEKWIAAPVTAGAIHHAVLVFDFTSDRIEGYLDGVSIGSVSGVGRLFSHSRDTGIGGMNDQARFHDLNAGGDGHVFGGVMDEVAIYANALDAGAVSQHWAIGSGS